MTALLRLLVTAGWGPVSYLEMAWLASIVATSWYLVGELADARAHLAVARDRIERWIAEGAVAVEAKALLQQGAWAVIGLVSAATPPSTEVTTEPTRAAGALVFTAALLGVQASNLLFARWRRFNRRRIAAALLARRAAPGVVPILGGRRWYDLNPDGTPRTGAAVVTEDE